MLESVDLTLVETLDEANELRRWLGERRAVLGVDTETEGLDFWRDRLRTVQLGDARRGWVIPAEGPGNWLGLARELLEGYEGPTVMQNAKFDLHFLREAGVQVDRQRVHDTRVMAVLTDNLRRSGLKALGSELVDPALGYLDKELRQDMAKGRWGWDTVPLHLPSYWQYAALDPVITVLLAERLWPETQAYREAYDVELACQLILTDMERRGVQVDLDYAHRALRDLEAEVARLDLEGRDEWGVENLGSDAQVRRRLLADGVEFTTFTEKTGEPSLAEDALREIDHPLARLVARRRHAVKVGSTYLRAYLDLADDDGRLHPSVNLNGARTGRMSIGRPSLQNLERSRLVRDAFVASEGRVLVCADYDQIELRLLASYARDEGMVDAFLSGVEMHAYTARRMFNLGEDAEVTKGQRQTAKTSTYTKLYGGGHATFARSAGVTEDEARSFFEQYDRAFPALRRFMDHVVQTGRVRVREEGRPYVTTAYGRRLFGYEGSEYKLVNYLIQGTAAEVLKRAMIRLAAAGLDEYLVLPVHDEFVLDVPEDLAPEVSEGVIQAMTCGDFVVPLTAEAARYWRWGEKYEAD